MTRVGSLCSGFDGLGLGLELAGFQVERTWFAETDPAMSRVLAHHWPATPNLGDITAVDWTHVEPVDVLTAGYPCQPLSLAGRRGGLTDERWLWDDGVFPAIRDLRPGLVLLENVPGHLSLGFGRVLGDLASIGYVGSWRCVRASDIGAPHQRKRVFVLAHPADADGRRLGAHFGDASARERHAVRGGTGGVGLSLLPTPAARDAERGFGYGDQPGRPLSETVARLLPTPKGSDADRRDCPSERERRSPSLVSVDALLPTPAARLADRWGSPSAETAALRLESGRRNLEDSVALLPTPSATNSHGNHVNNRGDLLLPGVVALLPTPRASDGTKGGPNQRGSSGDLMLPSAVIQLLPTPTATPYGNNQSASDGAAVRPSLDSLAVADRWGQYGPAIARWEQVLGRSAPEPTEPGSKGQPRLSPRFVEWMQGLPEGHVTDHVSRTEALRGLGNGVVPQQCAAAVAQLLAVLAAEGQRAA